MLYISAWIGVFQPRQAVYASTSPRTPLLDSAR